jgi:hypothetical protein
MGCLLAAYAPSEAVCIQQCKDANKLNTCTYEHTASKTTLSLCFSSDSCGCPKSTDLNYNANYKWGVRNDCSATTACVDGCKYASNIFAHSFYGRSLNQTELDYISTENAGLVTLVNDSLDRVDSHIKKLSLMDGATLKSTVSNIVTNGAIIKTRTDLVTKILDIVDAFENSADGPLYIKKGDIQRVGANDDGNDLQRAMLAVHQVVMDHVYNAGAVQECSKSVFANRGWKTAAYCK